MVYSLLIEETINSMRIVKLVRDVSWIPLHNGNIEKTALGHVSSAFFPSPLSKKIRVWPPFLLLFRHKLLTGTLTFMYTVILQRNSLNF